MKSKLIIGMIHMPPLPGSPNSVLTLEQLMDYAVSEARTLEEAGVGAAIVENLGDYPFFKDEVPAVTVAVMTLLAREVRKSSSLMVGVNLLRNACSQALSVAYAAGAHFIRCNVLNGVYATDQGIVEGKGAEVLRLRKYLGAKVQIFADVHVKHAYPLYNVPIDIAAQDLAERGGADAVIVSGPRSPIPPDLDRLRKVRSVVSKPILVGSGISLSNFRDYCREADGLIVGEYDFKVNGEVGGRSLGESYAKLVRGCGD
ncbi:BtpA/SgcQ family protein [Sulfodiicoccus acidiphilus]|uniref:BtpA/SgcQ family protein n=1 Tax=Sulfodiicoccus acidiphilus TaxID=1670455 RepID=UPI001E56D814|nr:BtpA/SgcQ family protein [Sulfodiicoccus acidiphilus]